MNRLYLHSNSEISLPANRDAFPLTKAEQERRSLSAQSALFTPGAPGHLGGRITETLNTSNPPTIVEKFPSSETRIEIHESVRDRHAFIVGTMTPPVNDAFLDTALLVQALKLADARRITVILPYFPYSRGDRKVDTRPPIGAKAVTDILKAMGAHQIVTVDLHATQVEGFFDGAFENLSGLNQLIPTLIETEGRELIVVSPDAGGAKRAENFGRQVEKITGNFTPLVVMSKFRPGPGIDPVVTLSIGEEMLHGKTCVLVDDMIDTGGSILAAAKALKEKGAARVVVCASHGIFSRNAVEKMRGEPQDRSARPIDQIIVTDSLPSAEGHGDFVRVVSIAPLIAEAIQRLDQSMGTLRELKNRSDLGELVLPTMR